MLDVIITVSPETPRGYVGQCRRSVKDAKSLCAFGVNVIETPAVPGNIGSAMQGGIMWGRAPYIVWVDDDDLVFPNAFLCLEKHFETAPSAIFAREIRQFANGRLKPTLKRHHLTAFRRDVVESMPMHEYALYTSRDMREFVEQHADPAIDEWSWVYLYRVYMSAGRRLREGR